MIAPALLLLLQMAAPPPADWSTLPELPVRAPRSSFDPSAYVRREVAANRCAPAVQPDRTMQVAAPVAVFIDAGGAVQRIVPRAIGCPTVEQYTAGYVSTLARRASALAGGLKPGWYRHVVTYRWRG